MTAEDLPTMRLWDAQASIDQPFNFFDDVPAKDRVIQVAGTGFGAEDINRLVVTLLDGSLIGDVSWHRVGYGPNERSAAYNIGIGLQPQHRGHGHGTRVQRLLAEYLFARTDVFRVEASTDVDNVAEQRALEKAGFTREGIRRGAQYRAGAYRDIVSFSRLRADQ